MCGEPVSRDLTHPHSAVADHIKPHKGDIELFFDINNVQTLGAVPCHNSDKQRIEKGGRARPKIGIDGWPLS